MEISWEHGYSGHYVLIKSEGISCSDYFLKVLEENRLSGLLPAEKRYTENEVFYVYEVTGKEPLKKRFRVCPLCYRDIKKILVQLMEIAEQSEEYLLSSDKLLLDAEVMFFEKDRLSFCYYPEKQTGFYESFRGFMEQLLKEVDHKDSEGTAFAYALYAACQKETFILEDFLKQSWQLDLSQEEPEPVYETPDSIVQKPKLFLGRSKRKKKEQIRRELWTEVWKLKGNQEFVVDKSPFIIGKQKGEVDAYIGSVHVSRFHAKLEQERGLFFLMDLKSTNGTFINGRRLQEGEKLPLSPGDRVSFADQVFLFVKEV